ncbi:hypothetical protein POM88_011041 [Heracleum sosnowskyi]|uniref:Retrotransposon gag domain-containing protein n=1 Tax=Heracleum sosnowskyi TaxID=360622 RepID=A0AAD8IU95_9APIA|nr:hypothetical protein POM88_011041 [Heracleum sosnowskyi]
MQTINSLQEENKTVIGATNTTASNQIEAPDSDSSGKKEIVNPEFSLWKRSDRLLRGWITGTLSEDTLSLVVGLDTSNAVWTTLNDSFAQSSVEREFHLEQKLQSLKKGTSTLNEYIRIFKSTCDQLASIGKPVDDRKKVLWLLNGLGRDYESFVTTMLKPSTPSYREVIPLLQSHETWHKIHQPAEQNIQPVAFYGGKSSYRKVRPGYNHFTSKGRGFMHSSSNTKASTLTPFKGQGGNNGHSHMSKNNYFNSGTNLACKICGNRSHPSSKCWYRSDNIDMPNDVPKALAAMTIGDGPDPYAEWFVDSAASSHMTGNPGRIYISRNFVFDEDVYPFKDPTILQLPPRNSQFSGFREWLHTPNMVSKTNLFQGPTYVQPLSTDNNVCISSSPTDTSDTNSSTSLHNQEDLLDNTLDMPTDPPDCQSSSCPSSSTLHNHDSQEGEPSTSGSASTNNDASVSHAMTTRSKAVITKPNPRYANVAYASIPSDPKTVKAALAHSGDNNLFILAGC